MSSLNALIPSKVAGGCDFDPESAAATSGAFASEGSSSFDTLIQHALEQPNQDANDLQRSSTSERQRASSSTTKRKVRPGAARTSISASIADSDPDQEEMSQSQENNAPSGSSQNPGATAVMIAGLLLPPPLTQVAIATAASSDGGSAAPRMNVNVTPAVAGRDSAEVSAAAGTKTASADQQEKAVETSNELETLARELASNEKTEPAHPKIADQESRHPAPAKFATVAEAEGEPAPIGISSAQQGEQMKKAVKTDKDAQMGQQNLPADSNLSASEAVSSEKRPASHAVRVEQIDALTSTAAVANRSEPSVEPTTTIATTAGIEGPQTRLLERAHEFVSLQAARVRETGSEWLSVVLKPAEGTQIALQLEMREGVVSAQASLHRGDYELLNRHWPELQQRLEAQGIHLSSLQREETSNPNQSRQPRHQGQHTEQGSTEISRAGSMTEPPGKRARNSHRGWETWA